MQSLFDVKATSHLFASALKVFRRCHHSYDVFGGGSWASNLFLISVIIGIASITPLSAAAPPASSDSLVPKIFHVPIDATSGGALPIQGAYLSSATAYAVSGSGPPVALPIIDRVGDGWLLIQLPSPLPAPLTVYLRNSYGPSVAIALNNAVPMHLDTVSLVPNGQFRLFGVNLMARGFTPSVTVGGLQATVIFAASTKSTLTVLAPASITPGSTVVVGVDNGDGSGPTTLQTPVAVISGSGDPLRLGVGWAGGFTFTGHQVNAPAACDGNRDDSAAIEGAVQQAAQDGGGVVQLPAGTCRITSTINLASRVILKGMGQKATILRYESNYPIYAHQLDLVGLTNLQLLNAGQAQEGLIWQGNTRSLIQNVTFDMGVSRQWFLTDNHDFLFDHNTINQTGSYSQQNPYLFNYCSGLVFSRNVTINAQGSPTFQLVHDSVFYSNRFTRDASTQYENPIVAHHSFVADFSYRISLFNNVFDVVNGPITNTLRNDGETFLVEGGGAYRTENLGTVQTASESTLVDQTNTINVDPFSIGKIPENYGVAIVAGKGAGQRRRVVAYANATLSVDQPWDVIPNSTSRYSTFVWGLEDALLIGNKLTDNPRGIWLYQSSVRNVRIAGNTINEGGGIFLRSYQNLSLKMATVQDDVLVSYNVVKNTTRNWMSYVDVANVSSDTKPFGTGEINIMILGNSVVANTPNLTSNVEDYAGQEGFQALLHIEPQGGSLDAMIPNILGTVMQFNNCKNCLLPVVIGSGNYGTVIANNSPAVGTPGTLTDEVLLGSNYGGSSNTLANH